MDEAITYRQANANGEYFGQKSSEENLGQKILQIPILCNVIYVFIVLAYSSKMDYCKSWFLLMRMRWFSIGGGR